MKVVVFGLRGFPDVPGGVESHCQELYPRLINHGFEITVITRSKYIKNSEYQGVKMRHLWTFSSSKLETIFHSFISSFYAKFIGADVVHIHGIGSGLVVPICKLLGMKVVVTNHGPDYDRGKWGRIAKWLLRTGEKYATKYADCNIYISRVIVDINKKINPSVSFSLIPNGISKVEYETSIDKQLSTLRKYDLENKKYIVSVARFVPEKGLHHLVNISNTLKENGLELVLIGDSDHTSTYSERLKENAKKAGVTLTGYLKGEELQSVFKNAAQFVLPSYHEGLPISLLEAMSYNLPIVASDIPANKEIALPEICYFKSGDEGSLVDSILKVDVLEEQIDLKTIYSDLSSKYNWDEIADNVGLIYSGLEKRV